MVVNDEWMQEFPSSVGTFGSPDFSDHSSLSVVLDPLVQKHKKPFRFYNLLLKNKEFFPLIASHWYSFNVRGSAMYRVSRKLRLLKKHIRDFSKDNYSNIEKRVQEAHEVLLKSQDKMLSNPNSPNAEAELAALGKWQLLAVAEESFFCQRSRINSLALGDSNTSYFHRLVKARNAHNLIHFLIDENGVTIDNQTDIENMCVDYFSDLMGGPVEAQSFVQSDIDLLLPFKCSIDQQDALVKGFTKEEIKAAFFSLPRNKTSGPDGYSSEFFSACWDVIGTEVVEAVTEFFVNGSILKQWNATTLVLIPKITNASAMTDFRPISCLNTVYKVISKLLAGRLKVILTQVILANQTAFMPKRFLAENVLLATDLVQGYNQKRTAAKAMLKVDLRKAFDSVKWDFVLGTLKALNMPEMFITWISQCISTASFSVSVNGSTSGFFKSTKGLRQGDPLSPYLFVLAMEVFSQLLLSRYESGYIAYHPKTAELKISHLMFADDVMVFFDGSSSSLHGISECLDDFASWSGLSMNVNKTELFYAGLNNVEICAIERYGFPTGSLPIRYLGLPLMSKKLKVADYEPLIFKLNVKFKNWAVKTLSFAGRLQLLKSVIAGTINFWTSAFILPKGCIRRIESLCSRFLWSGNTETTKMHKVSWATVCLPKEEGGLGLRRLAVWNRVLCLKFIWYLFSESESLWASWQKMHRLGALSFWEVEEAANDSWTWKQLIKLKPEAKRFIKGILGNGAKLSFWFDEWTPLGQLIAELGPTGPRDLRIPRQAKVAAAFIDTGWVLPSPRTDKALALHIYLTTVTPNVTRPEDSYEWQVEGQSCTEYVSSSTWEIMRPREEVKPWADLVWFKGSIPKHAFTMWVANYNRLPTRSRLAAWGIPTSKDCCLCSVHEETRDHLFLRCDYSTEVWRLVSHHLTPRGLTLRNWPDLLSWIRGTSRSAPALLRKLSVQVTIFQLWKQRNNVLHNNVSVPPFIIYKAIDRELRNLISARRDIKEFQNLMTVWFI